MLVDNQQPSPDDDNEEAYQAMYGSNDKPPLTTLICDMLHICAERAEGGHQDLRNGPIVPTAIALVSLLQYLSISPAHVYFSLHLRPLAKCMATADSTAAASLMELFGTRKHAYIQQGKD